MAGSGDYDGHNWVKYVVPASNGICYALEIDNQEARLGVPLEPTTTAAPTPGVLVAPMSPPDTSLYYEGHLPSCAALPNKTSGLALHVAAQIVLGNGQRLGPTGVEYISGIVTTGTTVVATFDDGSTGSAPVVDHSFTLFFGPGRSIARLGAADGAGRRIVDCTVSTLPAGPGPAVTVLTSDC